MASIGPHLLGIEGLSREQVEFFLDTAQHFVEVGERNVKKVPTLRGKTVINLFLEPSTRTRSSFEIAGKRMSADVINISEKASSTSKGETLLDTVLSEAQRQLAWQHVPVDGDVLTAGAQSSGSIPLPHRPWHPGLGLLLVALWAVERLVSERRRAADD